MAKILLVDDDARWRKDMAWATRGTGAEIVTAASTEEAMQRIAEEDFDVVVTDLELVQGTRDVGGLKVLQAAKEKDIYTQVIVCTAVGTPAISVQAMGLGAFDYMERNPVGTEHLTLLGIKVAQALEFRDAKLREGKVR